MPAPSRTPPPPLGRQSGPRPIRSAIPAAPSFRSPPRPAGSVTGSRRDGCPRSVRPAPRTRRHARAGLWAARVREHDSTSPAVDATPADDGRGRRSPRHVRAAFAPAAGQSPGVQLSASGRSHRVLAWSSIGCGAEPGANDRRRVLPAARNRGTKLEAPRKRQGATAGSSDDGNPGRSGLLAGHFAEGATRGNSPRVDGKEGVAGSSPAEGSKERPGFVAFPGPSWSASACAVASWAAFGPRTRSRRLYGRGRGRAVRSLERTLERTWPDVKGG